jgi:hypothetical protein
MGKILKQDLGHKRQTTVLSWGPAQTADSLQAVFDRIMGHVEASIDWYLKAKRPKKHLARGVRIFAIVGGAVAAGLPTLGDVLSKFDPPWITSTIPAGWSAIILGAIAALVLLDRFFGFSTGWIRFTNTQLQLRQIAQEFELDWEAARASWGGEQPTKEQAAQMLARCKAFITQVNTIVREETNLWIQEFQDTLRQIDETTKAQTAVSEPGSLNLIVTNGDRSPNGWKLTIDGNSADAALHKGRTAGVPNLMPGRHAIKIEGEIDGKAAQAERVVNVPAGGICEEALDLA